MAVVVILVGLVAAAWVVVLCLTRVRRLHRLHIRVDAARAGLDAALARRAVAAVRAGVDHPAAAQAPRCRHPRRDARAATTTPVPSTRPAAGASAVDTSAVDLSAVGARPAAVDLAAVDLSDCLSAADPEAAANALSRRLAHLERGTLAPDVRADLDDAERLLVIARLVHNDAVRDTLGLRSRRLVRWLRLAGTAPMPAYFEIADPRTGLTYDRVSPSPD